jgi:hypothetical protein
MDVQEQKDQELFNLRDLFFQIHGLELFEETNLKLNLLLRDAFHGIPFHAWYQWRPKSAYKITEQTWEIQIDVTDISKLIYNWLEKEAPNINISQEKYQKYLKLEVSFPNFIDIPIIQSWTFIKKLIKNPSRLNIFLPQHKSYQHFCEKQKVSEKFKLSLTIPIHIKTSLDIAIQNQKAVWFFKDGLYIAPSRIPNAGYGLFSLYHIDPGMHICNFDGKRLSPTEFQDIPEMKRLVLEAYVFESSFVISKQHEKSHENTIVFVIDPTNEANEFTLNDMIKFPNPGPWINEPAVGSVSNVFMQAFTYFDLPQIDKHRYTLLLISARTIYAHDEIYLHYEGNYCRKHYSPGEKCPDLLD